MPLYLGIQRGHRQVSFARIHKANLVNAGILPLEFENAADYEKIYLGDTLELSGVIAGIENGAVTLTNKTTGCVNPPALRHQRAPGADHPRGRPFELHPRKKSVNTRHFRAAPPFCGMCGGKK